MNQQSEQSQTVVSLINNEIRRLHVPSSGIDGMVIVNLSDKVVSRLREEGLTIGIQRDEDSIVEPINRRIVDDVRRVAREVIRDLLHS